MNRLKVLISFWVLTILLGHHSFSQDIQFSQYYNAPLYINPAFAGSAHHSRAMFHQRLQWPGLHAKYITSLASFDTYHEKYNSGFGLMVIRDVQGSNTISSTDIAAQYSYDIFLSSKYALRTGIQLGYFSRHLNYSELIFSKQLDDNGLIDPTNEYGRDRKNFADVGTGGIFYSKDFFFGFSGHHLNRPNQSFINDVSRLPVKYTLITGYKIPISNTKYAGSKDDVKDISITPTAYFKSQGKSDQLDAGLYFTYENLLFGSWYRGIPLKRYQRGLQNNEAFIVLLGWKYENFSFGYSYDFTLSKLAVARTGGAHEFNISYIGHKKYKKRKPMRRLPCPTFFRL